MRRSAWWPLPSLRIRLFLIGNGPLLSRPRPDPPQPHSVPTPLFCYKWQPSPIVTGEPAKPSLLFLDVAAGVAAPSVAPTVSVTPDSNWKASLTCTCWLSQPRLPHSRGTASVGGQARKRHPVRAGSSALTRPAVALWLFSLGQKVYCISAFMSQE